MSLDCNEFKNESGITGFLGGVISHACDEFNMKLYNLGVEYEDFESDIFYIGEDNEIKFEEAIKERLKNSLSSECTMGTEDEFYQLLDKLDFKLKKADESTLSDIIMSMYQNVEGDNERIRSAVEGFSEDIKYYLQEPEAIYYLSSDLNKELYECGGVISQYYTYIPFSICLVKYDKYIMLMVRGSNE